MGTKPLGEVLVEERLISREQLQAALERQRENGQPLGRILIEMGAVDERGLVQAAAVQIGVPYVDLEEHPPMTSVAALLPKQLAEKLVVVPVEVHDGFLLLATADPTKTASQREVAEVTGFEVRPALARRDQILAAIDAAHAAVEGDTIDTVLKEIVGPAPARPDHDDKELDMHELLERVVEEGASDLHITAGTQPVIRVHGALSRLEEYPVLKPAEIRRAVYSLLTQKQRDKLEAALELDLSYSLPGKARFRVNVYFQRDALGAAFRLIPTDIKSIQDLGVPPKVADFAHLPRGLVLVTGPTGSGKSTTLASIIDIANQTRPDHILTVEDPIEYLHRHKTAVVNQREVGSDTHGFAEALKHALRQDPDIILVGEMRDLETISTALTAAETGHLVFATLHTQDAPQSIDRIIDVFPPHQQQQVRVQLAATVQGIVTQQLLPRLDGMGRVVTCEVLIATPAIRNLIREGKTHMIYSAMQAGGAHGMQTMDQSLAHLVRAGQVSYDLALERCHNAEDFSRLAGRR